MNTPIKIMIIEDSAAYRKGIACALDARPNMELISEFGTAEIALRSLQNNEQPDILLLDLNLPGISGLDTLPEFKNQAPKTKIIILTQSEKEADVLCAIQRGAAGYLLKSASIEQLMNGIQSVYEGGATLDQSLAQFVLRTLNQSLPKESELTHLSKRELEVLTLIADGLVQKQIASQMGISVHTVGEYIQNIYKKLNVPNAPAAVAKAYKTGIFPHSNK